MTIDLEPLVSVLQYIRILRILLKHGYHERANRNDFALIFARELHHRPIKLRRQAFTPVFFIHQSMVHFHNCLRWPRVGQLGANPNMKPASPGGFFVAYR